MIENSSAGLVMLGSEVTVTVTREEHHQAALARFPVRQGMQRQVAVELTWCTITAGKFRGQRAIEVRLDGQRVGELTHLMSQRYAPLVAQLTARGSRPGCEALIQWGNRGLELLLRLPRNGNVVIPLPTVVSAAPVPPPHPVPVQRGSSQAPKWIAAAVIALIFVAALASTGEDSPSTTPAAQLATSTYETTSSSTTSSSTTTTTTTTTTVVPAPPAAQPPAVQQPPVPKVTTPAPPPPVAKPQPQPQPQPQCHPNYGGCVPIASDVDCAGGSGNGPAYVSGPIRVTGPDVYGLDSDKDGTACE